MNKLKPEVTKYIEKLSSLPEEEKEEVIEMEFKRLFEEIRKELAFTAYKAGK